MPKRDRPGSRATAFTLPDAPIPYSGGLEARYLPSPEYIAVDGYLDVPDSRGMGVELSDEEIRTRYVDDIYGLFPEARGERLSLVSSVLPRFLVPDDCVEDGEEFSGDGDARKSDFLSRFGREAARAEAERLGNIYGFQIHIKKLDVTLRQALADSDLAWHPTSPEPYRVGDNYLELHPRVGEAVMATLAIACATSDGLSIVGDKRSGPLHDCLLRRDPGQVYDTWLQPTDGLPDPVPPTANELFGFLVSFACDTSELSPMHLAEMQGNREPLQRLMRSLEQRAGAMVAMDAGPRRTEQFRDEAHRILESWRNDRANMDSFWRRFFGGDLVDKGAGFLETVIGNAVNAAPAVTAAAGSGLAGLALDGPMLAALAGLGVGVLAHGAKSYGNMKLAEGGSPYRYLTIVQKAGVVFRTDVHVKRARAGKERTAIAR